MTDKFNTWETHLKHLDTVDSAEVYEQKARKEWKSLWDAAKAISVKSGDNKQAWEAESAAWSLWTIAQNEVLYRRSVARHSAIHHWKTRANNL